ncbi:hypothetical protein Scep_015889 [Stephania cephalantha]|uniref:G-patch domain-containing protein n=1 Tax=Stephania cephalantha TaxID=152367 RepID=A0AAP0IN94_9MAGN
MGEEGEGPSSTAIRSSNIGFQLLKKCGWTEGTGLGVAEQGRLEPIQVHVKNDKQGLGSRKINNNNHLHQPLPDSTSKGNEAKKKAKALSKRAKKLQEQEKKLQDKEFERAFFREFWPDNV